MDITKDIQKASLEMLTCFINVCKKYDLRYYLIGGTCLGAVRHNGFIPWDDDIDVGMPRKDYKVFCSIAKNELPKHMFLQNLNTDKNYPMNFSKIRNSNTTFIETGLQKFNINHGLYIDIFPLDGYSNSKLFDFANNLLNKRIAFSYYLDKKRTFKEVLQRLILYIIFPTYKIARNIREKLIQKFDFDTSELVFNFSGAWAKKELMDRTIFGEGSNGVFEGIPVVLPKNADLYLKNVYGDYMTFPPVEKRVSHHFATVIDLNNSYIEYCK